MRKFLYLSFAVLLLVVSCKDKRYVHYYGNQAIYLSYDELRASVKLEPAHNIKEKGPFLLHNSTLYVLEKNQGVHIFDNSNPSAPINLGFIRIYGATDLSMKENTMYVNSYVDLVVLNCNNPHQPTEVNRLRGVFPYYVNYPSNGYRTAQVDPNKGVVIGFELANIKEENTSMGGGFGKEYSLATADGAGFGGGSSNVSGSMSTFTSNSHHLYILNTNSIVSFSISSSENPSKVGSTSLNRWAETALCDETHLYIGTTTGMQIYSAPSSGNPTYVSEITHIVACDPVAIDGNYAYYTIRSGTNCGMNVNKLEVVDISTITNPVLVGSFDLTNPHGLSAQQNKVWVCDQSSGVRCFNAAVPQTVGNNQLSQYTGFTAYDIIVKNEVAIVMGEHSMVQLDYSNAGSPNLLSTINF